MLSEPRLVWFKEDRFNRNTRLGMNVFFKVVEISNLVTIHKNALTLIRNARHGLVTEREE